MYLVVSLFGFEGRIWDLIVSVPDHCLSFYFPLVYVWNMNHDITFALLFGSSVPWCKLPLHLAKCQADPLKFSL